MAMPGAPSVCGRAVALAASVLGMRHADVPLGDRCAGARVLLAFKPLWGQVEWGQVGGGQGVGLGAGRGALGTGGGASLSLDTVATGLLFPGLLAPQTSGPVLWLLGCCATVYADHLPADNKLMILVLLLACAHTEFVDDRLSLCTFVSSTIERCGLALSDVHAVFAKYAAGHYASSSSSSRAADSARTFSLPTFALPPPMPNAGTTGSLHPSPFHRGSSSGDVPQSRHSQQQGHHSQQQGRHSQDQGHSQDGPVQRRREMPPAGFSFSFSSPPGRGVLSEQGGQLWADSHGDGAGGRQELNGQDAMFLPSPPAWMAQGALSGGTRRHTMGGHTLPDTHRAQTRVTSAERTHEAAVSQEHGAGAVTDASMLPQPWVPSPEWATDADKKGREWAARSDDRGFRIPRSSVGGPNAPYQSPSPAPPFAAGFEADPLLSRPRIRRWSGAPSVGAAPLFNLASATTLPEARSSSHWGATPPPSQQPPVATVTPGAWLVDSGMGGSETQDARRGSARSTESVGTASSGPKRRATFTAGMRRRLWDTPVGTDASSDDEERQGLLSWSRSPPPGGNPGEGLSRTSADFSLMSALASLHPSGASAASTGGGPSGVSSSGSRLGRPDVSARMGHGNYQDTMPFRSAPLSFTSHAGSGLTAGDVTGGSTSSPYGSGYGDVGQEYHREGGGNGHGSSVSQLVHVMGEAENGYLSPERAVGQSTTDRYLFYSDFMDAFSLAFPGYVVGYSLALPSFPWIFLG
eukprot:jgi/Mesvir1/28306/Mv04826-RA.1